jgi:hypothetical protein
MEIFEIENVQIIELSKSIIERSDDNVNTLTDTLIEYLQSIPEPLIPYKLYNNFIEAENIKEDSQKIIQLREVVNKLSKNRMSTLIFLLYFFYKIDSYSIKNNCDSIKIGKSLIFY